MKLRQLSQQHSQNPSAQFFIALHPPNTAQNTMNMINIGIPNTIGSIMASTTGLESSVSDDDPPPLLRTPGTKGATYSQKKTIT